MGTYYPGSSSRGYLIYRAEFIPFNVPGAVTSGANDISPSGKTIVGTFKHEPDVAKEGHGFVAERNGLEVEDSVFTEVVYPDTVVVATRVIGINAGGDLVGAYNHADGVLHGFLASSTRNK